MKNRHFIMIIVVVIFLGFLLLWYAGRPKREKIVKIRPSLQSTTVDTVRQRKSVNLYFSSPNGEYLVNEMRPIECADENDCVGAVVRALVSGPEEVGAAVLPAEAELNGVEVEEGTAVLDFSSELTAAHPGGSQSELLTVYALANSIAVNFPHIRQIAIRVDGQPVETLKGHVDLRRPVIADFTFARESVTQRLMAKPDETIKE